MRVPLGVFALIQCLPQIAGAVTCRDLSFEDAGYTVCDVQAGEDLQLFWQGPEGPFADFTALTDYLETQGETLTFAMNAGMFDEDLAPVGLYIQAGTQLKKIVTRDGPGNFGLLPNGVFCTALAGDSGPTFRILESRAFAADPPACWMATQSGPMLVLDGALHPLFRNVLGLRQALFLDGSISRLYAPQLDRNDIGFAVGPIIGVLEKMAAE